MRNIDDKSIAGSQEVAYSYMQSAAEGLKNLIEHINESELSKDSDIDSFPLVVIVCGKGNNGGDGLALAVLLSKLNYEVKIYCLSSSYKAEAKQAHNEALKAGLAINYIEDSSDVKKFKELLQKDKPEFIVDALLGTGSKGSPKGLYKEIINNINNYKVKELSTRVISVDIPSGLNADTGKAQELSIIADHTVCMGFPKLGFAFYPARSIVGELHLRHLDYPATIVRKAQTEQIFSPGIQDLVELMPSRHITGSKFDHGIALIVAGSKNMGGAAILSAKAALESGLGMLHICSTQSNISAINTSVPEAVSHALIAFDDDINAYNFDICAQLISKKEPDVICMGPALSIEEAAQNFVKNTLDFIDESKKKAVIILDADAINAFRNNPKALRYKNLDILLTPHYGELARISPHKISAEEIADMDPLDKIAFLRACSKTSNTNILLKGSPSILVDVKSQQAIILPYGNSGLAKAGSGDALSGIIASLAAQIICAERREGKSRTSKLSISSQAAILGAFLLGKSAERLSSKYGEYSISASKVIEELHQILKAFSNARIGF